MEENQLRILEERINNAISFIENLKSKEKALIEEKERLEGKTSELEKIVRDRELKIEALQENQLFLKNKIEAILDKLEALAGMEGYEDAGFGKTQTETLNADVSAEEKSGEASGQVVQQDTEEETGDQTSGTGEIIIEENLVDLKSVSHEQPQTDADEGSFKPDEKEIDVGEEEESTGETASDSEKTLFNEEEHPNPDNQFEEGQNESLSSDYNNS